MNLHCYTSKSSCMQSMWLIHLNAIYVLHPIQCNLWAPPSMDQAPWQALPCTVDVATLRLGKTLLVVSLAANFQATADAVDGARATLILRDGAIDTGETIFAFAGTIVAVAFAAAFFFARLEGAIVPSTTGVASTLAVHACPIARAVAWANLLAAIFTSKSWAAEAGTIEAVAIWRPASSSTILVAAVKATPSVLTFADTIVAFSMVATPVGAHLHRSTAIQASETLRAIAGPIYKFAVLTFGLGNFALQTHKSILTKAIIALALAIYTIRAVFYHLVAGFTSVSRFAFALASQAVASTMHGTSVRAETQFAGSSFVSSSTVAGTIYTLTMCRAVLGASFH